MGGGGGNPTLSFPSNPSYGDTYTWSVTGDVWFWNGINWDLHGGRVNGLELFNPKATDLLANTNQGGSGPYQIYSNVTTESVAIANGATTGAVDIANGAGFNGTVRIASASTVDGSAAVQIAAGSSNTSYAYVDIAGGPSASGRQKDVEIGKNGVSGSTTNITLGSSVSGSVTNITAYGTVSLPSTTSIGSVSATEIGYLDGVTSNIQTQLSASALPSQSGNSGKFLTTNGSALSWAAAGGGSGTLTYITSGTFGSGYEHTFSGLSSYSKIYLRIIGYQAGTWAGGLWVNNDSSSGLAPYDISLATINDNEYGFSAYDISSVGGGDYISFGYSDETKSGGPAIYFIELDNCLSGSYTYIHMDSTFASNGPGGYGSGSLRVTGSAVYKNTAAISSITLSQSFGTNPIYPSTYSIYGVL